MVTLTVRLVSANSVDTESLTTETVLRLKYSDTKARQYNNQGYVLLMLFQY